MQRWSMERYVCCSATIPCIPARPLAMERIVEGTEAGLETLRMPRGLVVGVAGPAQRGNEQRDRRRRPRHPIKLRVGSKGRRTEWADGRDQTSVLLLACASSRDTRCSIAPEAAPVIGPRVDGPGRAWDIWDRSRITVDAAGPRPPRPTTTLPQCPSKSSSWGRAWTQSEQPLALGHCV